MVGAGVTAPTYLFMYKNTIYWLNTTVKRLTQYVFFLWWLMCALYFFLLNATMAPFPLSCGLGDNNSAWERELTCKISWGGRIPARIKEMLKLLDCWCTCTLEINDVPLFGRLTKMKSLQVKEPARKAFEINKSTRKMTDCFYLRKIRFLVICY